MSGPEIESVNTFVCDCFKLIYLAKIIICKSNSFQKSDKSPLIYGVSFINS